MVRIIDDHRDAHGVEPIRQASDVKTATRLLTDLAKRPSRSGSTMAPS